MVDTYDTIHSGIPNAIRVAHEVLEPMETSAGHPARQRRYCLSDKKARKMLTDEGLSDCKIFASNSLDEYIIRSILDQGAQIDSFGVGERMITASSDAVFGGVYKEVGIYDQKGK